MRRPSIKPLSLAFSLLLTVAVLFSLSLPVWADTEVSGDLNGDTLVNSDDIAILEALLNGSQEGAAGVNYDISGNKMVDSKDLIVLKHLVDPSQPALADKLSDGETDDVLCLVESVEGGALQSAVVRGDSTKALELNGSTLTVRFAKVQNWSNVSVLTLDTLWLSGNQTLTVSLLDADGNVLGTAGTASAKDAGWSSIELSLPTNRAKVGGIAITAADDAHVYMDNLRVSLEDKYVLTRAEMENALTEMAWNWYFKGSAYDYDSTSLNSLTQHLCDPLCGYVGGKSRLTLFPVLENATSHSNVFTVCSGFPFDAYMAALDYPILGAKYNALTMTYWRNSSYYPVGNPDASYDMTVLRWHSAGQNTVYNDEDTNYSTYFTDENGNIAYQNWYDADAVREFFANYEENFRPGDIIVSDTPGHTYMYIGNGMVMDDNGTKYDMTTGVDGPEDGTSLSYRNFNTFFNTPNGANQTWVDRRLDYPQEITDENGKVTEIKHNHMVVLRPLNLLTIDDGDGDPSNDKLNPDYVLNAGLLKYKLEHDTTNEVKTSGYHIDEATQTRLQYPGMNIDRTVNITPYGTAVKGETITYSVKITNNSNNANYVSFKGEGYEPKAYEGLTVVEHIPANTVLADAPGATVDGDTLTWKVTVPAGETVEVSYTVTVTGELGDKIVSGGGWVNNIPSNTIENSIGGKKLDADKMANFSTDGITVVDNTDFAEQVYQVTTGHSLQLPKVQELMDIFFSDYEYYAPYGYYLYSGSSGIRRHMYSLNAQAPDAKDQPYYDMLVPGYYGGLWCYTDEYNGPSRIGELRLEYLEAGDILVYMDLTAAKGNGSVYKERNVAGSTVMVYLGNGSFASVDADGNLAISSDALCYTEAFMHDLFLCLRPSQVYDDLDAGLPGYTVTWKNHDGTVLETDTAVPYLTLPTYEGETPANGVETDIFTGWSPAIVPVTGDVTYTAVFTDSAKVFTVTWVNSDGTELETDENVAEGTMPSYNSKAPTKAAANGYTYAFAGWDKEISEVTGNVTYTAVYSHIRELTSHKLTDSELDALASITPDDVRISYSCDELTSPNSHAVLPWAYQQAGIAVPTELRTNKVYATAKIFFTLSGTTWTLNETVSDADYTTMLVTNAYGGTQVVDAPAFDVDYLQIGDLFCAAYDKQQSKDTATHYYVYLYQGDGKFLLLNAQSGVFTCDEVLNRTYTYNDADYNWSYYFVIRPEEYGNPGARDMALRSLTDAEAYRLSKLTTRQVGYPSYNIKSNVIKMYTLIGINDFMTITDASFTNEDILARLFTAANPRVPKAAEAGNVATYHIQKMMLPCYGGSFMKDTVTLTDAIENGTLQIGDVVAGGFVDSYTVDDTSGTKNSQFTALYQGIDETGKGKFVILYKDYTTSSASTNMTVEMYADEIDTWNMRFYYALRPQNLATVTEDTYTVTWVNADGTVLETDENAVGTVPTYDGATPSMTAPYYEYTFTGWTPVFTSVNADVTYKATYSHVREIIAHELTEAEKQALRELDITSTLCGATDKPSTIITNVYNQLGIDLTKSSLYLETDLINLRNTLIRSGNHEALSAPYAERYIPYFKFYRPMLVDNLYGGTGFAAGKAGTKAISTENLQVGDIFCAMVAANTNVNDAYTFGTNYSTFVLVYQDDGQFGGCMNVVQEGKTSRTKLWDGAALSDIQTLADANAFSFYLVLRPSQLAAPYTVNWVNDDGSVLETDAVPLGIMPTYDGATPTKTREGYTYTFAGWDKTIEVVTGNVTYQATYTYVRDLTAHRLTDEELNILASITPADVTASLTGVNLDATGPWVYRQANITYSSTVGGLATVYSTATKFFAGSSGSQSWSIKAAVAGYQSMLVVSAYGGRHMQNAPAFDLNTLQIGDMFCGMYTYGADNKNIYATYLYQGRGEDGEGKFLLLNKNTAAVFTLEEVLNSTYTHTDGVAYGWGCYYVIRPENCILRDPSSKELTDAEIHAISKLTPNNLKGLPTGKLYGYISRIYNEVGIDLDLAGKTASDAFNLLFYMPSGSSYCIPKPASTDEVVKRYQTMLTDCYGGGNFETDVKLSESELQVGDVFVARADYAENDNYWSGVYQDDGNFLMYYWDSTKAGKHEVVSISTLESNYDFHYYFVLRPNNLAN